MPRLFLTLLLTACLWAEITPGTYKGTWSGETSGNGGALRLVLSMSDGKPVCEIAFSLDGSEVMTKVTECKVDGDRFEAAYQFDLAEYKLESRLTGQWKGTGFEGRYRTRALPAESEVDQGAWKAQRQ